MKVCTLALLVLPALLFCGCVGGGTALQTSKDWTGPEFGMEFVWVKALKCWVGKYEVTNEEYRKKEPRHDSKEYQNHSLNGDRQPVVYVNYAEAQDYANWLTEREQKAGRLPKSMKYRLPTEKEWQTFAQCGDGREYPWGDNWPPKYGNYSDQSSAFEYKIDGYSDGFAVTCPVEKSGKNDWGLYGVGGNVWECCSKEPSGAFGAWRGASWYSLIFGLGGLRCSFRVAYNASDPYADRGFRLVLSR